MNPIDPSDEEPWPLFDDSEITEIINGIKPSASKPWLDFSNWMPKSYDCDCGGKKAGTTHVEWCSTRKI